MLAFMRGILNWRAERKLRRRFAASLAVTAKVQYRRIGGQGFSQLAIGEGSVVEASITSDRAGASVQIGRNTFIGRSHLISAQEISVGDDVLISWGCHVVDHDSHALSWSERSNDVRLWYVGQKDWSNVAIRPVRIGNRCWLGFNVTVLKGVTIGDGAVIGACSVVTRDVPPGAVVAGNPARIIRRLEDDE